jgi:hypothetical protein
VPVPVGVTGHRTPNPATQGPSWTPQTTSTPSQLPPRPRGRTVANISPLGLPDRAAGGPTEFRTRGHRHGAWPSTCAVRSAQGAPQVKNRATWARGPRTPLADGTAEVQSRKCQNQNSGAC